MEPPRRPLVAAGRGIALRRWAEGDAAALAVAWADPDIAGRDRVPADASLAHAERWIRGWEARVAADVALDLVVGPSTGDEVWGEVGVSLLRLRAAGAAVGGGPGAGAGAGAAEERTVWEAGWWLVAEHRGRGLAGPAVSLLLAWVGSHGPARPVVARIRPGNGASEAVATGVGMRRRGRFDAESDLWVRPLSPPGPGGAGRV